MTTITFEENIKLTKRKFKTLSDFKVYLDKNSSIIELKKVDKNEIPSVMVKKIKNTKKMARSEFVNI